MFLSGPVMTVDPETLVDLEPLFEDLNGKDLDRKLNALTSLIYATSSTTSTSSLPSASSRDPATYFTAVCKACLGKEITQRGVRLLAYRFIQTLNLPSTAHSAWAYVIDAVKQDFQSADAELVICAIKTCPLLPTELFLKAWKSGEIELQEAVCAENYQVRRLGLTSLADILAYKLSPLYVNQLGQDFVLDKWKRIADCVFDAHKAVAAAAFAAIGLLFNLSRQSSSGVCIACDSLTDYTKDVLRVLAKQVADHLVKLVPLIALRFSHLTGEYRLSAIFPLVCLTVEACYQPIQLYSAKEDTLAPAVIVAQRIIDTHMIPLLQGDSSQAIVFETASALLYFVNNAPSSFSVPITWIGNIMKALVGLLLTIKSSPMIYAILKEMVDNLGLVPDVLLPVVVRGMSVGIKSVTDPYKRVDLLHRMNTVIISHDCSNDRDPEKTLLNAIITDGEFITRVWKLDTHTAREEFVATLCLDITARLQRHLAAEKIKPTTTIMAVRALTLLGPALQWQTPKRTFASSAYIGLLAVILDNSSIRSTVSSADLKQLLEGLLSKLPSIKNIKIALRAVFILCKYLPDIKQETGQQLVQLLRKRYFRIDAAELRVETLMLATRSGHFGTGTMDKNPRPKQLEGVLMCVLLLAARCEPVRSLLVDNIIPTVMKLHPDDIYIQSNCRSTLLRIALYQQFSTSGVPSKKKKSSKITPANSSDNVLANDTRRALLDFAFDLPNDSAQIFSLQNLNDRYFVAYKEATGLSGSDASTVVLQDQHNAQTLSKKEQTPSMSLDMTNTGGRYVVVSAPSDPFLLSVAHITHAQTRKLTLYFRLENRLAGALQKLKLLVGWQGDLMLNPECGQEATRFGPQTQVSKIVDVLNANEEVYWSAAFTVLSFAQIAFSVRVLMATEKENSNLFMFAGGGGGGGAPDLTYHPVNCLPYLVSVLELVQAIEYSPADFAVLWNRQPTGFTKEVRLGKHVRTEDVMEIFDVAALHSVYESSLASATYVLGALSTQTWWRDQILITITACSSFVDKGFQAGNPSRRKEKEKEAKDTEERVAIRLEVRASSPAVLAEWEDSLRRYMLTDLLSARFRAQDPVGGRGGGGTDEERDGGNKVEFITDIGLYTPEWTQASSKSDANEVEDESEDAAATRETQRRLVAKITHLTRSVFTKLTTEGEDAEMTRTLRPALQCLPEASELPSEQDAEKYAWAKISSTIDLSATLSRLQGKTA